MALLCAAGAWATHWIQRPYYFWSSLGSFLGYSGAVVFLSNAVGQALRVQRAELSAKRLTVSARGHTGSLLCEDVVSIAAASAAHWLGRSVPTVNVFLRDGSEHAILIASRKETAFIAEILCLAMDLPPDPLRIAHFTRTAGDHVAVSVGASGVVAYLCRRPSVLAASIVSLSAGAVGAVVTVSLFGGRPAIWVTGLSIFAGYHAWHTVWRFSSSISGGIWDGEFVFSERRLMRSIAQLSYDRRDVADVTLVPSRSSRYSRLCIVLSNGEQVLSEATWPTPRLQALADTINEARCLCP